MHLLHERCLSVNKSVSLQNPMNFLNDLIWINYVLEHRLRYHAVEHAVAKRNSVPIQNQFNPRTKIHIRLYESYPSIFQQLGNTLAQLACPENQYAGRLAVLRH